VSPVAFIPPPPTDRIEVGPLVFHLYGLCIALGVLAAFWLANRRWIQAGGKPGELERPGIWAVLAGFVGGRLAYVATHTGDFQGRWLHVLYVWEGGLALYGGLTLGILTGLWVARRRGLPVLRALDAAIPAIPLAQAFGRWGNYFNQELFGTPTTVPWALEVDPEHRPDRYLDAATFHPTFLYESLYNLAVVVILIRVGATRRLRPGSLALLYLVLYGAGRFLLELLRTDTTYRLFGLSRNAYVSLAVVVGASVWLVLRERRGAPAEDAEPTGKAEDGEAAPTDEPAKDEDAEETSAPAAEETPAAEPEEVPAGEKTSEGEAGEPPAVAAEDSSADEAEDGQAASRARRPAGP
jgi:prolipoprotein diacylglyceryl transferase